MEGKNNDLVLRNFNLFQGISDHYDADKVYLAYFSDIPCSLSFGDVNEEVFLEEFRNRFGKLILKEFFDKYYGHNGKECLNDHIFILPHKTLIYVESESVNILAPDPELKPVRDIIDLVKNLQHKKRTKAEICVVVSDSYGLTSSFLWKTWDWQKYLYQIPC